MSVLYFSFLIPHVPAGGIEKQGEICYGRRMYMLLDRAGGQDVWNTGEE